MRNAWTWIVVSSVSGKISNRRRRNSADPTMTDVIVNFKEYRCFYPNCVAPTPSPPATLAPLPSRRPANFMYVQHPHFSCGRSKESFFSLILGLCFCLVHGLTPPSGQSQLKTTSRYQRQVLMWSSHQVGIPSLCLRSQRATNSD